MKITKEMKVAEVFDRYPQTRPVFQEFGFGALMNPALRAVFGRITSVEAGCRMHGVALDAFLNALNGVADEDPKIGQPAAPKARKIENPEMQNILRMKTDELVKAHPETHEVFVRHFGPGCFSCPAFGKEDIAFACSMHNTDPAVFAEDCLKKMGDKTDRTAAAAIRDEDTVNDIIRRYPAALEVLHRFGIDSCCGGAHSIKKAAIAHGIPFEELEKELLNRIVAGR